MKAYRATTKYEEAIIFAETRGKAMWNCVRSYCEAYGFPTKVGFKDVKLRRAHDWDFCADDFPPNVPYNPKAGWLETALANKKKQGDVR
jgi:hypothetical protein